MSSFTDRCEREDEEDRLLRLAPYITSKRFALTADDVLYDYRTGRDRYTPRGKQEIPTYIDPFDVERDWIERA